MQRDEASIASILAARAARTNPVAQSAHIEGAHVWAASGLVGFAAGSPVNTWAMSGLTDPFASVRATQHDPSDWVTTVSNEINRKRS